MKCPNCGTMNSDLSRYCMKCGTELKPVTSSPTAIEYQTTKKSGGGSKAVQIGGITSIVGGGLVIIGWFLPLVASMNGLQLSVILFLAAIFSGKYSGLLSGYIPDADIQEYGILFTFLSFFIAFVFILLVIMGVLILIAGFRIFSFKLSENSEQDASSITSYTRFQNELQKIKSKSLTILIISLVIFLVIESIPYISLIIIGPGLIFILIGSIVALVGVFFSRNNIRELKPEKINFL